MGSLNKVILIGNLGRDAELRYTTGGHAVSTLNIATTETWKDKDGEKQEKTEWHRIIVWGKAAEALNDYLVKGKQILVEGKLQTRKWDDKEGVTRYTTEIKSDRITLLGSGGKRDESDQRRGSDDAGSQEPLTAEDIPFSFIAPFIVPYVAFSASMLL